MNKTLQLRRGTTTQHLEFTGLEGEVTVDTDKHVLVLHDGNTAGGIEIARLDQTDVKLNTKADKSTTLSGYGITDAYTKTQTDTQFFNKNEINLLTALYYTKETVNTLLSTKADNTDVYTKTDINNRLVSYVSNENFQAAVENVKAAVAGNPPVAYNTLEKIATVVQQQASDIATKFDKAGGTITSNVTIEGNLTVTGTTTTVTAENLVVSDNFLYLNDGGGAGNVDIGFAGGYNDGTYHHTGLFRDATDGRFKFFDSYVPEPDAAINIDTTHPTFHLATVQAGAFIGDGSQLTGISVLPSQTDKAGKYLTTDGTNPSWATLTIPTLTSLGLENHNTLNVDTAGTLTVNGLFKQTPNLPPETLDAYFTLPTYGSTLNGTRGATKFGFRSDQNNKWDNYIYGDVTYVISELELSNTLRLNSGVNIEGIASFQGDAYFTRAFFSQPIKSVTNASYFLDIANQNIALNTPGEIVAHSFTGKGAGLTGVVKTAAENGIGDTVGNIITLTQAQYSAIPVKNASTLYIII